MVEIIRDWRNYILEKDIRYIIGICGHYGGKKKFFDGQTVKTQNLTNELVRVYGKNNVITIDTYGGKKKLVNCLKGLYKMLKNCDNIIILPAHNSVKIFPAFLILFNTFYNRRLHYVVIGGWLPEMVRNNKWLSRILKQLDYIYVETSTMKKKLEEQKFKNIEIMPNFKDLHIGEEKNVLDTYSAPFRICTFSRVMKEKGIQDIIEVVKEINNEKGKVSVSLDIYGQIDIDYKDEFKILRDTFPAYINYKGMVSPDKSVEILRQYFLLVFPTRFYTEGIPGTIIDAYAAGTPVISSRWESFSDVVDEGVTGKGYQFGNKNELKNTLLNCLEEPEKIVKMKTNCLKKAEEFMPKQAVRKLKLKV